MVEENLEKLQLYFKYDLAVKEILVKSNPNSSDDYDLNTRINYLNKIANNLDELEVIFDKICLLLNDTYLQNNIKELFNKYRVKLSNINPNIDSVSSFYHTYLSNMRPEFINIVEKSFFGYQAIPKSANDIFDKIETVNELLHAIHASIVNNENLYQEMPVVAKDGNAILYGVQNDMAYDLFLNIPRDPIEEIESPREILALKDRILIMARDLGHALTIDIKAFGDKCQVKYFIPKVCNYDMVNSLKGVRKVKEGDMFTDGEFECNTKDLTKEIVTLMENVPMDQHMFIKGGILEHDPSTPMILEAMARQEKKYEEEHKLK